MCSAATLVHGFDTIHGRKVAKCYLDNLLAVPPSIGNCSGLAEVLRQIKELVYGICIHV